MSQKYKVYINNTPKFITENWKNFCSDYKLIKAAGGVVYNSKNQLLMIYINGKWDLPNGKVDENEKILIFQKIYSHKLKKELLRLSGFISKNLPINYKIHMLTLENYFRWLILGILLIYLFFG